MGKMKSDAVYNSADNMVMVKSNGDEINIICNTDNLIKRDPRMKIDLNSIAKGYGVDVVFDFLKSKGFENISGSFTVEDLAIGYNAAYLKDILSHLTTDEVIIKLNSPISAGLFYPKEQLKDSDLTMLLMPIRLNN